MSREDAMPRVCVVMPAYRAAGSIAEAVQSVLAQDYGDIVMGVAIPASDLETLAAVRALSDARIRILEQTGKGIADARNLVLREIKADLYTFLDADDRMLPGMLPAYVRHRLETGRPGMRCSHYIRRLAGESHDELRRMPFLGQIDHAFTRLALMNFVPSGTVMVDREILEQVGLFDTRYHHAEDWHLWLRISRRYPLFGLDTVSFRYSYGKLNNPVPCTRAHFDDGERVLYDVCDSRLVRQLSLLSIRAMACVYYLRTLRQRRTRAQYFDFRFGDFLSLPPAMAIFYLRKFGLV